MLEGILDPVRAGLELLGLLIGLGRGAAPVGTVALRIGAGLARDAVGAGPRGDALSAAFCHDQWPTPRKSWVDVSTEAGTTLGSEYWRTATRETPVRPTTVSQPVVEAKAAEGGGWKGAGREGARV